jgi:hypothetical protein
MLKKYNLSDPVIFRGMWFREMRKSSLCQIKHFATKLVEPMPGIGDAVLTEANAIEANFLEVCTKCK